jgi:hypothetical protein
LVLVAQICASQLMLFDSIPIAQLHVVLPELSSSWMLPLMLLVLLVLDAQDLLSKLPKLCKLQDFL